MSRAGTTELRGWRYRPWRHSLYARAALFLLLGAGCVLGAVTVWSSEVTEEFVDRLLGERLELAATVGRFVESELRSDLAELARVARSELATGEPDVGGLRARLAPEYPATHFAEGVFVLSPDGALVVGLPDAPGLALAAVGLDELLAAALRAEGLVCSPLVEAGRVPVLLVVEPVYAPHAGHVGFVGGLVQPAASDLLGPMVRPGSEGSLRLELVDQRGVVVGSNEPRVLYRPSDHGAVLATSIREARPLEGRCHSCHSDSASPELQQTTDVLAFAPLPTLALGVAVHQPEAIALAPAFALRRRLNFFGLAFLGLFVVFTGLSVRSVVRPVKRLTEAVRAADVGPTPLALSAFGRDEVGELAEALERYHARMLDARAEAEASRHALGEESERQRLQRGYLQRVLRAQEDERRRIARELHDTLAQDLAALRLEIERLASRSEDAGARRQLDELEGRTAGMLAQVRQILLDQRLSQLHSLGFLPALQAHVERVGREAELRTAVEVVGDERAVDEEIATTLFRIAQESLLNAVQHARAEHVLVTVEYGVGEIIVTVEDDGCGFDPHTVRAAGGVGSDRPGGLGLVGMEERARLVGGALTLTSGREEGTVVRVVVPESPDQGEVDGDSEAE